MFWTDTTHSWPLARWASTIGFPCAADKTGWAMLNGIYTDVRYHPGDLIASFSPHALGGPDPSAPILIPYEQALMEQGERVKRRDRVHCLSCLTGKYQGACRCKFVDARGQLAGIGSSIYFIPTCPDTPGCLCRVQTYPRRRSEPFYPRPCQFRIVEIGQAPRTNLTSSSGVHIRCNESVCRGNAFFPYGLGTKGGSPRWVSVVPIANLCQPFVQSILGQIRKLHEKRTCQVRSTDLDNMLLNIYGIRALCYLQCTCKGLAQECTLHMLVLVGTH